MFLSVIKQESKLALRKLNGALNPLIFFAITISILSFLNDKNIKQSPYKTSHGSLITEHGSDHISSSKNNVFENQQIFNQDQYVKTSSVWICLIFSIIISSNNFLKQDFKDGTLEQLLLSGNSFGSIIFAKITANWLIYSSPIIFAAIIANLVSGVGLNSAYLALLVLIVTAIINLLSCFASCLVLSNSFASSLLSVLILPLTIPVIIFANNSLIDYQSFLFSIKILVAFLIFLSPILTFASALAIKANMQ